MHKYVKVKCLHAITSAKIFQMAQNKLPFQKWPEAYFGQENDSSYIDKKLEFS